jgi:type I restriction enzyme S subunit
LRSEFPQGWSEQSLEELIATVTGGTSVICDDRPRNASEKAMLKLGAVSSGAFRPSEHKVACGNEAERLKVPVRRDTVLFVRKNTPELVGRAAYVDADYEGLFLPDLIWELRPKPSVSARWLGYWLESPAFQALIPGLAAGSSKSMLGINRDSLLASSALVPPPDEQERIAATLGAWDEAIYRIECLIAAKRRRARETLRLLVFGDQPGTDGGLSLAESRVAGAGGWPMGRMGDFASERSRVNRAGHALPVLSCTKHAGLVLSREYFAGRRVHSEDTSGYKIVNKGEFAYATNHLEEGSIGLQEVVECGLVSPMYTVFDVDEARVDRRFLISVLKTETYRRVFEMSTSSSVDRRGGLRWEEFAALPFALPPIEEQRRITAILEVVQTDLAASTSSLARLRLQKCGLMQKLLTGERRLEASELYPA